MCQQDTVEQIPLGLLLGTKALVMTPNLVDLSFLSEQIPEAVVRTAACLLGFVQLLVHPAKSFCSCVTAEVSLSLTVIGHNGWLWLHKLGLVVLVSKARTHETDRAAVTHVL